MLIGLISDTHNLLRAEALRALAGSAHILHAGDIGGPDILDRLRALAPVTAVRGNNDRWAHELPDRVRVQFDAVGILILHDLKELAAREVAGAAVVVTGHSHRPSIAERDGVLYVNPGSAGPRRFKLPVTVATLAIEGARAEATIVELAASERPPAARTQR